MLIAGCAVGWVAAAHRRKFDRCHCLNGCWAHKPWDIWPAVFCATRLLPFRCHPKTTSGLWLCLHQSQLPCGGFASSWMGSNVPRRRNALALHNATHLPPNPHARRQVLPGCTPAGPGHGHSTGTTRDAAVAATFVGTSAASGRLGKSILGPSDPYCATPTICVDPGMTLGRPYRAHTWTHGAVPTKAANRRTLFLRKLKRAVLQVTRRVSLHPLRARCCQYLTRRVFRLTRAVKSIKSRARCSLGSRAPAPTSSAADI